MVEWFISYQVFDNEYNVIAFGSQIRSFSKDKVGADVLKSFDAEISNDHKCPVEQIHYVSLNKI